MNIEELRDYCLSLPNVTEATPFEKFSKGKFTILVFYIGNHMFCYFNVDDFTSITVKCKPEKIAELKERYAAVDEPYNGNKKYWISLRLNEDLDDDHIKELVRNSYNLVKKR
ncbi:MAG: MmcQ/YjbR family DNA-binding protein [Phocaeicola sp.]|uniref:MmcQ/YjbR family DNA-binding protein n=1 Tax=Phocaeicola sp. TaxID=2773926 RepID=UPI003F9F42D4